MTQPLQCSTCVYWRRVRKDANWGECVKIGNFNKEVESRQGSLAHDTVAYFHPNAPNDIKLNTRDIFFCALHEQQKAKQTLVEAVQQASRDFNEASKS